MNLAGRSECSCTAIDSQLSRTSNGSINGHGPGPQSLRVLQCNSSTMTDRYQRFGGNCCLRLQDRGLSQKARVGSAKLLLILASPGILGSESRGTHYHISISRRTRVLHVPAKRGGERYTDMRGNPGNWALSEPTSILFYPQEEAAGSPETSQC
jgi:hypothetical protein